MGTLREATDSNPQARVGWGEVRRGRDLQVAAVLGLKLLLIAEPNGLQLRLPPALLLRPLLRLPRLRTHAGDTETKRERE